MSGFVRRWGHGPEPALLLHCSLAHAGAWAGMAAFLEDRLRMVAPDMLGHGRAPDHDPAVDYHDAATAYVRGIQAEAPCHLVGHSFGATVALRLAIEAPARALSLTLIEPVLFAAARGTREHQAEADALADLEARIADGDMNAAARLFLGFWGGAVPLDRMPPEQATYMVDRMHIIGASDPALREDSARLLSRLHKVACPVLLLEGRNSPAVIGDVQSALARALPRAERRIVDGAGHMGPITHPGPFADAIRSFLDSRPARQDTLEGNCRSL